MVEILNSQVFHSVPYKGSCVFCPLPFLLFLLCDLFFFHTLTSSMKHWQNWHYYKRVLQPEIWARVSSANPLDHLLVCDTKLLARKQQSGHDSSLRVCMNDRFGSWTLWRSQSDIKHAKHEQSKGRVCLCILSPLMVYAFMNSGVHWLLFSFLHAGGMLISCSSMSHTNMSSGCRQTAMLLYNIAMYSCATTLLNV